MSMSNYTEKELLPAAVEVINNHPGGIDTQKLIRELRFKLKPNGEDTVILLNRSDDKFSQKVRNLKSHKTLEKKNFVTFSENKFFITNDGKNYLNSNNNEPNLNDDKILFNFIPLKYFNFPKRSTNALKAVKCEYVYDLNLLTNFGFDYKSLLKVPNFGRTSIKDFDRFYSKYSKFITSDIFDIDLDHKTISEANIKKKDKINQFVINNIETYVSNLESKQDTSKFNHINQETRETKLEKILDVLINKSTKSDREIKIFYERILGDKTLEEIGLEAGVTRERIRQQEKKILRKIKRSITVKDCLEKISIIMRKLILESDEDFMKKLISNNLIDGRITVYQLKKLFLQCGFEDQANKIQKIRGHFFVVESEKYRSHLLTFIRKYFRETMVKNGIINIPLMLKEIQRRQFKMSKTYLMKIISPIKNKGNSIIIENEYYLPNFRGSKKRSWNRLIGGIHSTMSVTKKIDTEELIECLKRYRRIDNFSPPPKILKIICQNIGYEIEDEYIVNPDYTLNNNYLVGVRKKLFQMFIDNERVMTYEDILDQYEKYDLNINSVHVMIYENLFTLPKKGIYVLAGTEISEDKLNELDEKRQFKLKELAKETELNFHHDGDVVVKFNKKWFSKHYIWLSPSFINQIPMGNYEILINNKKSIIKIFSSRLWTSNELRDLMKKLNSETISLKLNLIEKRAEVLSE